MFPADSAALEPYLIISSAEIYVRDQTLSRQFYLEKLGFGLVYDSADSEDEVARYARSAGVRWIAVGPMVSARPMFLGSALALIKPAEGSEQARRIGSRTGVMSLTEDIAARHKARAGRGVCFEQAPTPQAWGIHAIFAASMATGSNWFNRLGSLTCSKRRGIEPKNTGKRSAEPSMRW